MKVDETKQDASKGRLGAMGECMLELRREGDGYQMGYGGDVFNTAVYAERSGANVSFLTATGDDNYSEFLVSAWQEENIETKLVRRITNATPALYAIEIDEQGERSFQYWREASPFKRWLEEGDYRNELVDHLTDFDCLYFSGITLAMLPDTDRTFLLQSLTQYRDRGGLIAFDPNYRPRLWKDVAAARHWIDQAYQHSDIALPSIDDERQLRGDELSAESLATQLKNLGVDEIVIKQGSDELYIHQGALQFVMKPEAVTPIDTTAAGDAFNGAYLAARIKQVPLENAAETAASLARQVILKPGAIVSTS